MIGIHARVQSSADRVPTLLDAARAVAADMAPAGPVARILRLDCIAFAPIANWCRPSLIVPSPRLQIARLVGRERCATAP